MIFMSMSIKVASDRKTMIFCVSATAPSRLASLRVLSRCEEGGDTWRGTQFKIAHFTFQMNLKEPETTVVLFTCCD